VASRCACCSLSLRSGCPAYLVLACDCLRQNGHTEGPLGSKKGEKYRIYRAEYAQDKWKADVHVLARKAIRDHERFVAHFDQVGLDLLTRVLSPDPVADPCPISHAEGVDLHPRRS
jgi:hypothetical protein